MNILITTQYGGIAGSTYSIFYLAQGLIDKGHHIVLGIPKDTLLSEMADQHGIPWYEIPFRSKVHLKSIRTIRKIVQKEQIDIINPQESKDRYNVIVSKVFYRFRSIIVLTRRQRVADNNFIKRWIHVRFSEKIIVVSRGLQQLVQRKGFPIEHTLVIHNGLPTDQYVLSKDRILSLRSKYKLKPQDVVIGCVARPKRQDLLVEAMKKLPGSWKLLLVGIDAKRFAKAFPMVETNEIKDRIIFTGSITDKSEVFHHYALMSVNVLPTQMDGFGLVLIEAMAMGVPVIGSDYGGVPDVIEHGKSGFIFNNEDVDMLSQQIQTLIEDRDLKSRFVANGSMRALNDFSINNTINKYDEVFQSLLTKAQTR